MALTTLLNGVTATGASLSVGTDSNKPAFIQISGLTVGTVAAQGSVDNTNWATIETALTANGIVTIQNAPKYLRANVTAWTSGSITAKVLY